MAKRLLKERQLPAYRFTPGKNDRPQDFPEKVDGEDLELHAKLDPKKFWDSKSFYFALDLYNFGYYWEAHVWLESLWNAAHREGLMGDFLKGLIMLCAAGVKARTGQEDQVLSHAKRARELFIKVGSQIHDPHFGGLSLLNLVSHSEEILENPGRYVEIGSHEGPLFPYPLYPQNHHP